MRTALALVVLLAAGPVWAGERLPTFPKRTDYGTARGSLIALGWKPVTVPDAQPCDDDERCKGRPEMVVCAGTGAGNCIFLWRRADTLIEVGTIYESPPMVAGIRCRAGCAP